MGIIWEENKTPREEKRRSVKRWGKRDEMVIPDFKTACRQGGGWEERDPVCEANPYGRSHRKGFWGGGPGRRW
jgi:hypothetical protein